MNTVQKNFTLTEGSRSRIVVNLPEDVDPNNYEVFAGNDKCKLRHFVYDYVEYGDHFISLVSEPAPQAGYPLPYQIFIKDKVSNVEWLLVTGQVTILNRVVGTPGIDCEEINASLTEEIIEITIYSKEDLDKAVQRALDAAEDSEFWAKRSMAWAEGDPGSTSHSSMYWASIASDAATAAECYKNAVIAAKDEAIDAKEAACQSAATALEYMNSAHDYALDAQSHANCANIFAGNATQSAQDAANYSSTACLYKQQTCEYLDEVTGIAASKQDKLTAGRNIVITKSGDDTFICALGGGGEGGDVYTDRPNNFLECNVFDITVNLKGGASIPYCASDYRDEYKLTNMNGDLYWGNCKLNGQGGGEGGDVYTDRPNTFECTNTFNNPLKLKQGAEIPLCGSADFRGQYKLTNYCGNLYWGCSKLNDQGGGSTGGDVYTNRPNTFVCTNRFNSNTEFNGNADFNGYSVFESGKIGINNQNNNAHYFTARLEGGVENLYWNGVKLNNQGGGGDVYTDRNNTFTGVNTFQSAVNFISLPVLSCGVQFIDCGIDKRGNGILSVLDNDLYWGNSKLNDQTPADIGDVYTDKSNTFTCANIFNGDVTLNGNAEFTGSVEFAEDVEMNGVKLADTGSDSKEVNKLTNIDGDLYWGNCKINGQAAEAGDVYTDRNNAFTGTNTFSALTTLNGAAVSNGIEVTNVGDQRSANKLTSYNGDIYWGNCKLNNQISNPADVYTDGNNNFTGENTFNDDTTFNGDVYFNNNVEFDAVEVKDVGSDNREVSKLTNYNGDIYWGTCKLNGQAAGGDVYTNRNNNLTGVNTFNSNTIIKDAVEFSAVGDKRTSGKLVNYNGDLYWGSCKLNNQAGSIQAGDVYTDRDNEFISSNTFQGDVNFNSTPIMNDGVEIVDCGTDKRESGKLTVLNNNLYWGLSKLNNQGGTGGGDVYTDRYNVFLECNIFPSLRADGIDTFIINMLGEGVTRDTRLHACNNNLYWGTCKLNDQGGAVTPAFITLTPTTEMKHGKTYKAQPQAGTTNFSNITLEQYATSEIWFEISSVTAVTLPNDWSWVDNIQPTFAANTRYLIEVKSDGYAIIAKLKYSYNYGN